MCTSFQKKKSVHFIFTSLKLSIKLILCMYAKFKTLDLITLISTESKEEEKNWHIKGWFINLESLVIKAYEFYVAFNQKTKNKLAYRSNNP